MAGYKRNMHQVLDLDNSVRIFFPVFTGPFGARFCLNCNVYIQLSITGPVVSLVFVSDYLYLYHQHFVIVFSLVPQAWC